MNAIECEHLALRFGRTLAVDDVTFALPAGSIMALIGADGSGKTTLLKLLLNLLSPSKGKSSILGCDSAHLPQSYFQRIGYLDEDQVRPDWMTLFEFLAYCRPFYPAWDRRLEAALLERFNIPTDRPLSRLPRGKRMKAALLSNLAFRPELLVLDEPFAAVDPKARDDIIEGILEITDSEHPSTIVISSQDITEIERLADWIGILVDGRLVLSESTASLESRFRRIEVMGPSAGSRIPDRLPAAWSDMRRAGANLLQFTHTQFRDADSEAELRVMFPEAKVSGKAMTLREILSHCSAGPASKKESP